MTFLNANAVNGLNLFAYCGNNPVNKFDPTGQFPWLLVIVAVALLFTPAGAKAFQSTISIYSYIKMATTAIWDEDVRNDMNAIKWNPFNSDESAVANSSKVSFYKGVPVFRKNGSSSGSFGVILLSRESFYNESFHWTPEETIKHEWGHSVQLSSFGVLPYLFNIGIPSAFLDNGDNMPWEITADILGGIEREYNEEDVKRGWDYFLWGRFVGPFWW